jgi:hypothetical protein
MSVETGRSDGAKAGSEFGYFVGTWKCKESWTKSPISDAYESTATLIATNVTDGVWIAWSYVQDPSPKVPQPPKGNDLWGYDPGAKQFVRVKADNFAPGHLTNLTSKGFVGDTISWCRSSTRSRRSMPRRSKASCISVVRPSIPVRVRRAETGRGGLRVIRRLARQREC